jgi:hypothetical protein
MLGAALNSVRPSVGCAWRFVVEIAQDIPERPRDFFGVGSVEANF